MSGPLREVTVTTRRALAMRTALESLSDAKPSDTDLVFAISDAIVSLDRALEPFEHARRALVKQHPVAPGEQPSAALIAAIDQLAEKEVALRLPAPIAREALRSKFGATPHPMAVAKLGPMLAEAR